ncbi:MAG: hypothetical protein ACTTKC_01820 [Treponema sp.]|uniref:hypothetical protein n=1 Tax=Treponema sp. TaxID=166 RepID=UPI003FA1AC49
MRSGQRVVISLLTSVILFAAFTLAAFFGLFSTVEARFYRPSLIADIQTGLHDTADILDSYLDDLKNRFYTDFVQNDHVKQSFSFEQSGENIKGREDAAGSLFASSSALTAIRIIDSDGKKIHYSTLSSDILRQNTQLISYKLYKDIAEIPYEYILSEEGEPGKLIFDPDRGRILYSFPFYDSYSAYRGTIVFYTAASDFARELIRRNSASITDSFLFTGTAETPLFVLSFPPAGRELLQDILIKRAREKNIGTAEKIIESEDSQDRILFSQLSRSGVYILKIYEENLFLLSDTLKLLLLISVFITSFLIIFLIFNIKQDDMLVIRDKIRRFQFAVIQDYLKRKEEVDWNAVCADMKRRKQEINIGIKKSLGRKARRHVHEVDYLLDKNWDEIIAILQNQNVSAGKNKSESTVAELKLFMEELAKRPDLISAFQNASSVQQDIQKSGSLTKNTDSLQADVAAVSEADDVAEPVEVLEDVEALEEVESLDEVEPLEEVEGLEEVDSVEAAEEVESLEEAESVEEAEVPEAAQTAEDAEALEEVESLEEVAALEEVDSVEAAEEAESLEEAESVEKAEVPESTQTATVLEAVQVLQADSAAEPAEAPETTEAPKVSAKTEASEKNPVEQASDPDDPLYEELRIGERPSVCKQKEESSDSHIEDIFSGIEIGLPDFSVLDEVPKKKTKIGSKRKNS